jgi:signal transduction histidine kinase
LTKKQQDKPTILIIDDNSQNLQVALNILNKEGYNLLYAQDGKKGIAHVMETHVDLILLDVMMPDMDGYHVCEELQNKPEFAKIPIIFLTVKDEEDDIVRGFECGGVDYITKPFHTSILLKRVETHIKLSQATKDLQKLNTNLQEEVQEKVHKIRVKDQILFQQAKMASMGEMIANIAHQWRQPLSSINSVLIGLKLKLALDKYDLSKEKERHSCIAHFNEKLDNIENYTTLLSNTIDDFRNFFKPNKEKTTFSIAQLIQTSQNLLSSNFENSDIHIITDIQDVQLHSLENELMQVIINILNNAKDALATKTTCRSKFLMIRTHIIDNTLRIHIVDSAGGISKEIVEKIFEPYFTTKHQSHGTGIGLYMSKEIIEKHLYGKIETHNIAFQHEGEDGYGAEFIITLPLDLPK